MLAPEVTEPYFTIFAAGRSCERFAARCIESVLSQEFRSFQLIVVDDASPDSTWAAIESAMDPDDARVWAFRRPERAYKLANFLWAWPCMRGQVIVELDLDDAFAHPRVLTRLHRYYTEQPRTDATVGSCQTDFDGGLRGHPGPHVPPPRIFNIAFAIDYPAPRTWRRRFTERAMAEQPAAFTDPATGQPWRVSADFALFAPAMAWARYIHPVDEVMVNVTRTNGDAHDFREFETEQVACARGIRAYWADVVAAAQGSALHS